MWVFFELHKNPIFAAIIIITVGLQIFIVQVLVRVNELEITNLPSLVVIGSVLVHGCRCLCADWWQVHVYNGSDAAALGMERHVCCVYNATGCHDAVDSHSGVTLYVCGLLFAVLRG